MTEDCRITPPPPHLLKKFSAQAQNEAKKRNGAGYLKTFATLCIEWAMNSKTTPNDRQIRSSEITPPPELVRQWIDEEDGVFAEHISIQAARWGADQELDACCEWVSQFDYDDYSYGDRLRAARRGRTTPPSLKELNLKHLEVMERDGYYLPEIISNLRRAIESLPS